MELLPHSSSTFPETTCVDTKTGVHVLTVIGELKQEINRLSGQITKSNTQDTSISIHDDVNRVEEEHDEVTHSYHFDDLQSNTDCFETIKSFAGIGKQSQLATAMNSNHFEWSQLMTDHSTENGKNSIAKQSVLTQNENELMILDLKQQNESLQKQINQRENEDAVRQKEYEDKIEELRLYLQNEKASKDLNTITLLNVKDSISTHSNEPYQMVDAVTRRLFTMINELKKRQIDVIQTKQKEREQMVTEMETMRGNIEKLENDKKDSIQCIEELRNTIQDMEAEGCCFRNKLEDEIQSLLIALALKQHEEDQNKHNNNNNDSNHGSHRDTSDDIDHVEDVLNLELRVEEKQKEIDRLKVQHETLRNEFESEMKDLKVQNENMEDSVRTLKQQNMRHLAVIENLKQNVKEQSEEIRKQKVFLKQNQQTLKVIMEMERRVKNSQKKMVREHQERVNILESDVNRLTQEIESKQKEIEKLRIENIKGIKSPLDLMMNEMRYQINEQAMNQKHLETECARKQQQIEAFNEKEQHNAQQHLTLIDELKQKIRDQNQQLFLQKELFHNHKSGNDESLQREERDRWEKMKNKMRQQINEYAMKQEDLEMDCTRKQKQIEFLNMKLNAMQSEFDSLHHQYTQNDTVQKNNQLSEISNLRRNIRSQTEQSERRQAAMKRNQMQLIEVANKLMQMKHLQQN